VKGVGLALAEKSVWGETSPLCWTKITKWQEVQSKYNYVY